jgi:site-specific DNA-methyltransferase (adenine-specific)
MKDDRHVISAALTAQKFDRDNQTKGHRDPAHANRNDLEILEFDRLYPGNCLELFPRIVTGSMVLDFADPPFNIGYDYDIYDDRREAEAYLDWTKSWEREVVRTLKPNGTFWLAIGDEYAAELKFSFTASCDFRCEAG